MIENIIEQIKTSEEKAKKTVEFSENEASSIIEKAYEDSDASIKESEAKINEMILLARKKAADDASAEKERLGKEFEAKIIKMKNDSTDKKEKIVSKIINRILE